MTTRRPYGQTFLGSEAGGQPGISAIYREHPNLDYVLNPTASYMNERQFNAHYLILPPGSAPGRRRPAAARR